MARLLSYFILFTFALPSFGQSSVLKSGKWFKIGIEQHGIYRLTFDDFKKMGFDPAKSSPDNIRIYGMRGGMLAQENSTPRPSDLVELAIMVEGASDGKFDKGDYVLFYAEGAHKQKFISSKAVFELETNLYADKNFYFVTISEAPGKRIQSIPAGTGGTLVTTFNDYSSHEVDEVNILHSGREWFGENFELSPEHSFDFSIPGIVENTEVKIVSEVMAQSTKVSAFKIFFNDQQIAEQQIAATPNTQYGAKGRIRRDTVSFNSSSVLASQQENQRIRYNYIREAGGRSIGYLNYFSIHYIRRLALYGDQVSFRNPSAQNNLTRYQIADVPSGSSVWNVTDPLLPKQQQVEYSNNTIAFSSDSPITEEFIAFNQNVPAPELVGEISNQDIHGLQTPNLLIISHADFLTEAHRLADHRMQYSGISAAVVTIDEVFNEFSSGRQDVTAIRDAAKFFYEKSAGTLKSLLLIGKGAYDYKQHLRTNYNFVPTYESRNSLSPLETYSSDDYFAFLESNEGEWAESVFADDHTLDIGVGRLPVKSLEEARIVVDKLIAYDIDASRFGNWRKDIAFVADDGSNSDGFTSIHQSQANSMAENIEAIHPEFNTRKIFLGTYQKNISPNGETIPKANEDISEEFDRSLIINYTGHGSEKIWADERVLTPENIEGLRNKNYPFLVTATCEFGRHDDPLEISSAELTVLKEKGGCIGLVTTARPVNSSTNYSLNLAFYEALHEDPSGSIGAIVQKTKNNSMSGVSNRNFSLLGDPSMSLALPLQRIAADYIKTESGSDTLKALSKVIVKGRVLLPNGETDAEFEGTLNATLFDKRTKFRTIGKNNPAYEYDQWFNPLFRGQSTVKDGAFEFSFILPKNIDYDVNPGKLSLYALDVSRGTDAAGASSAFKIGESESNTPVDTTPPIVKAFMGDSTFINGGLVSPNTMLVVKVKDENGINISNYGIGNTMMASLDNDAAIYLINEHYVAVPDDFTTGWVHFPIYGLAPGHHTLTVRVWDTYNNPSQHTIEFNVAEEGEFIIEAFGNYPNPFIESTTLFFRHNRPGEDLEASLTILNAAGMEIGTYNVSIPVSTYEVDVLKFENSSKKLAAGLYFARIRVRSLADDAESVRVTKLLLTN